jgi:hypothetical protein
MALVAMKRLMDKEKWDRYYEKVQERSSSHPHKGGLKLKDCVSIFAHIRIIFLFNVVLRKYVPKIKGAKVLEVGSAPGDFLVTLNKVYGFIPYGVEYS